MNYVCMLCETCLPAAETKEVGNPGLRVHYTPHFIVINQMLVRVNSNGDLSFKGGTLKQFCFSTKISSVEKGGKHVS
jgi:hypothetical protein